MDNSEEKRIAEEIMFELEKDSKDWEVCPSYILNSKRGMSLKVKAIIWPLEKVNLDVNPNFLEANWSFDFSYKFSHKLAKCIRSFTKRKKVAGKNKGRIDAMEKFKKMYVRSSDGKLYIHDKKKIK